MLLYEMLGCKIIRHIHAYRLLVDHQCLLSFNSIPLSVTLHSLPSNVLFFLYIYQIDKDAPPPPHAIRDPLLRSRPSSHQEKHHLVAPHRLPLLHLHWPFRPHRPHPILYHIQTSLSQLEIQLHVRALRSNPCRRALLLWQPLVDSSHPPRPQHISCAYPHGRTRNRPTCHNCLLRIPPIRDANPTRRNGPNRLRDRACRTQIN